MSDPLSHFPYADRSHFVGFERVSVRVCDYFARHRGLSRVAHAVMHRVSYFWMSRVTRNLWKVHGIERVADLEAPRGVIMVANHRSFFDMYVIIAVLMFHRTPWVRKLFFPVRAEFFYDRPFGLFMNFAMSGLSMWPPVFRDKRRGELNPVGLKQMIWALQEPGVVLGFHPEGKRNTDPDPWSFERTHPGVGMVIKEAHPDTMIVPIFIAGFTNDFLAQVSDNFRGEDLREHEMRFTFGEPIRVGELNTKQKHLGVAKEVMEYVRALAEEDRERYGPEADKN